MMKNVDEKPIIITDPVAVAAMKMIYENNGPGELEWGFETPGQVVVTDGSVCAEDGMLLELYLGEMGLHGSLAIHDISTLKSVQAWENYFWSVDFRNLPQLNGVDLSWNQIESLTAMNNLPALETLDLTGNKITELSALAGLENLQEIFVAGNPLEDISAIINLRPDLVVHINYPEIIPECGKTCIFKQLQCADQMLVDNNDNDLINGLLAEKGDEI